MNLEDCRQQINAIDDQLIQLFIQRMDIASEVARQKRLANLPVYHPEREQAIVKRLSEKVPPALAPYVQQLYTTIFTLSRDRQYDLNGRCYNGKSIPPYATIGRKLGHSYSKLIHQAFGKYDFDLIELEPDEARDFILNAPYRGLTVTIPYKKLALELADERSQEAQRIGCANTLVRESDGKLHAYNTDYDGFKLMAQAAGADFQDAKVLILGSGGTSLTTRTVAKDAGAREVIIVSRTGEVNYQNVASLHADADIIINTTPVGMFPETEHSPLDLTPFSPKAVLDVVYNPMKTRLKLSAEQRNIPVSDGLLMLVAQAKFCMDHFLRAPQPTDIIRKVVGIIRRQTANIVLVGMPGSGKSTISQLIAQKLNKRLISTDDRIVAKAGKTIATIFQEDGEDAFRQLECQVIAEVSKLSNVILDTGGGAILNPENRMNLASNGFIYYLQRDVEALQLNAGRPLSTSIQKNAELLAVRDPIYRQMANHTINNNSKPDVAAQAIMEAYDEDSCH